MLLGTSKRAMWLCKNSENVSLVGLGRNFCLPPAAVFVYRHYQYCLCTRTYFKWSSKINRILIISIYSCGQLTRDLMGLKVASLHCLQVLTQRRMSMCDRRKSEILPSVSSRSRGFQYKDF